MIDLRSYPVGTEFKTRFGDIAILKEHIGMVCIVKVLTKTFLYDSYTGSCLGCPQNDIISINLSFIND